MDRMVDVDLKERLVLLEILVTQDTLVSKDTKVTLEKLETKEMMETKDFSETLDPLESQDPKAQMVDQVFLEQLERMVGMELMGHQEQQDLMVSLDKM